MSSKKTTTSTQTATNAYNPQTLGVFNGLQPYIDANIKSDLNPDLTANPLYNLMLGQSLGAVNLLGQKNMANTIARGAQSGFGEGSPFVQGQIDKTGRLNSSLSANAVIQNLFAADQRRQNALSRAMAYQPLVTGQTQTGTSTQKSSGAGTWLPQVAGMGLAYGSAFMPQSVPTIANGGPSSMAMTPPYLPSSAPAAWGGVNPFSGINLNPTTTVAYGGAAPEYASGYSNPFVPAYY